MDNPKIMADFARYFEPLQRLGNAPVWDSPTIDELQVSKAQMQSGYAEMKQLRESGFEGNFTDFLCLVSTRYIAWLSKGSAEWIIKNVDEHKADIKNMLRLLLKNPKYFYDEAGKKMDKKSFTELTGLWFELYQKDAEKSKR